MFCAIEVAAADQPPRISAPANNQAPRVDPRLKNLSDWVRVVLERHPDLLLAEAESRQTAFRAKETESTRWPQLSVTGGVGHESQRIAVSDNTVEFNQRQLQLRSLVPLLDRGLNAQIRIRKAQAMAGAWALAEVHAQLITRTVELYIEVLRNEQMTELARQNLKLHRAYVAQMKDIARIDLGRASDLPMAQSRVALAESVLVNRLAHLESARVQWGQLTGQPTPQINPGLNSESLLEVPSIELPTSVDLPVADSIENSPLLQKKSGRY